MGLYRLGAGTDLLRRTGQTTEPETNPAGFAGHALVNDAQAHSKHAALGAGEARGAWTRQCLSRVRVYETG
jgi:hypothetical protein